MRLYSHLAKSRLGIYYLRLYVPKSLQPIFGTAEMRRSLDTRDPKRARDLAHFLCPRVRCFWAQMKRRKDPFELPYNLDEILGYVKRVKYEFPDGTSFEAEGNTPQEVADYVALAAPHLLDGVAAALKPFASDAPANYAERPPLVRAGRKKAPTYRDLVEPAFVGKRLDYRAKRTEQDMRQKANAFADFIGDKPIAEISPRDVADFKAHLVKAGAAANTFNKYSTGIATVFNYAIAIREYVGAPPTSRQRAKVGKTTKRKPFRPPDLETYFAPAKMATIKSPAEFWFPLLSLHTGMRVREIGQLQVSDIYREEGVWVIDINEIPEENSLKNEASHRIIPIPQGLIDLGLLDYVDDVKSVGAKRLFPWLTDTEQGFGANVSKTFSRRLEKEGIKTAAFVFHSFRSTANGKLARAGVDEAKREAMLGHEHDTTNSKIYDGSVTLQVLVLDVAPLLRFEHLDYAAILMTKGRFLQFLRHLPKPRKKREKVDEPDKVRIPQPFKPRGGRKPTA